MNICYGKSAKGGYNSNGQGTILHYVPSLLEGSYFQKV